MEFGWLQSLIYGFVSGVTEILPVSADAHQVLLMELTGASGGENILRLAAQLGAFFALLLTCRPRLSRLHRESKIAALPPRHRRRQPDAVVLMEAKVLKTAAMPIVISLLACFWIHKQPMRLWALGILLACNGLIVLLPQYLPRGNKDSRSLSGLDAMLIGLGGALGVMPGLSAIGGITTVAAKRGVERQYSLELALVLCIPASLGLCLLNLFWVVTAGMQAVTSILIIKALIALAAAFAGSMAAISMMRFFAVKVGFSGFAYYIWGISVLTFLLYLL